MRWKLTSYADDTIFFGKTSMENVKAIKVILRSFELVSGLKINFSNSGFGVKWESVSVSTKGERGNGNQGSKEV